MSPSPLYGNAGSGDVQDGGDVNGCDRSSRRTRGLVLTALDLQPSEESRHGHARRRKGNPLRRRTNLAETLLRMPCRELPRRLRRANEIHLRPALWQGQSGHWISNARWRCLRADFKRRKAKRLTGKATRRNARR